MRTVLNFLKYCIVGQTTQKFYHEMRNDYLKTNQVQICSNLRSFLFPKYNIETSEGVLGKLTKLDVSNIVSKIEKQGYYIFNSKLEKSQVEEIKKFALTEPLNLLEVNNGIKYSKKTYTYPESKGITNRFQFIDVSGFLRNSSILNLILDLNFLHIANEYLKTKPIIDIITMWWSNTLENKNIDEKNLLKNASAQMFHFDLDRLKFLKFFIYLTDVTDVNGPHVYVKGTHKKIPQYITIDGRYSDELIYENDSENIVEIVGQAGTIIAVDTRGIHKGKELEMGERLIFQFEFANSLFGNPGIQKVTQKYKYPGIKKYCKTYKLYFN